MVGSLLVAFVLGLVSVTTAQDFCPAPFPLDEHWAMQELVGNFVPKAFTLPPCSYYTCSNENGTVNHINSIDYSHSASLGSFTPAFGNLTFLEELTLDTLNMTGTIPSELGKLTRLRKINLKELQVTGTLPTEIGNFGQLTTFMTSYLSLTGTLPTEIGKMSNLEYWDMCVYDSLSGNIPSEFGDLSKLTILSFYEIPSLSGTVPSSLGKLTNLVSFRIIGTGVTGGCWPFDYEIETCLTDISWSCDCPPPSSCHQRACYVDPGNKQTEKWLLFSIPLALVVILFVGIKAQIPSALNRPIYQHLHKEVRNYELAAIVFVITTAVAVSTCMLVSIFYGFPSWFREGVHVLQTYVFPALIGLIAILVVLLLLRLRAILSKYENYLGGLIQ
eukprot:TRINITY_DN3755_c0_g1_i1.p1 TRINITY_DN3755_c0_g1~~TRINITY_DN3755_c0_g1_i1.p1  ORF type:complete len:388 (-),score=33.72 TRINITY_DN3755_c0_g1_i1:114-1277(-)